jgi:hypothetical protein
MLLNLHSCLSTRILFHAASQGARVDAEAWLWWDR